MKFFEFFYKRPSSHKFMIFSPLGSLSKSSLYLLMYMARQQCRFLAIIQRVFELLEIRREESRRQNVLVVQRNAESHFLLVVLCCASMHRVSIVGKYLVSKIQHSELLCRSKCHSLKLSNCLL